MSVAARTPSLFFIRIAGLLWIVVACAGAQVRVESTLHEPVVQELVSLLDSQDSLKQTVDAAIETADLEGIQNLDELYTYLDDMVTWIPTERELVPKAVQLHYIVNQAPGDRLNEHPQFSSWMKRLIQTWGKFLDTPASAQGIDSFATLPNYNVEDYFVGPSGWLTFNQFFAREMRPGKRPVGDPRDDRVIVSPADAVAGRSRSLGSSSAAGLRADRSWVVSMLLSPPRSAGS